jgi:hypothetical protein
MLSTQTVRAPSKRAAIDQNRPGKAPVVTTTSRSQAPDQTQAGQSSANSSPDRDCNQANFDSEIPSRTESCGVGRSIDNVTTIERRPKKHQFVPMPTDAMARIPVIAPASQHVSLCLALQHDLDNPNLAHISRKEWAALAATGHVRHHRLHVPRPIAFLPARSGPTSPAMTPRRSSSRSRPRTRRAARGERIYVIGDVHGRYSCCAS